ncbi:Pex19p SCDLUD_004254 [Saccharomycodes ludwigii]|uniref:Pex19p n=1 Tax=Saccharomycodes ludwigii TaxID=36035 RepID=UPI001E88E0F3|nr:hypothetical protein SCDLUD_004254 [Saccharomycodes ludwigii]KAH3899938.1 hypothetical protein SCDLUD_004254 [Saccharomycodes ludwigii]
MSDIDDLDSYLNDEDLHLKPEEEEQVITESVKVTNQVIHDNSKDCLKTVDVTVTENIKNDQTTNSTNDDEVIEKLEKDFKEILLANQDDSANASEETKEEQEKALKDFKDILSMMNNANEGAKSGKPDSNTFSSNSTDKVTDFKDIVSNTLDRLKENTSKVEKDLQKENPKNNDNTRSIPGLTSNDDVLQQLLSQLLLPDNDGDGSGKSENEGGESSDLDNALLKMLDQMCTKEVLYPSMKELQHNFIEWLKVNDETACDSKDKWETYQKQFDIVNKIVGTYELPDYSNDRYGKSITEYLDQLEELGDMPVSDKHTATDSSTGDVDPLLLNEDSLKDLDSELQENCKQQ